jgi:6,7-dimethyl-8-ribityllumazine synthase
VPGALEIPHVLASAAMAGLIPGDADGSRFDGAVALGCVIRGETSHYDIVCREANHWLNETALRFGIPVGNGILTVENEAQAVERAKGGRKSKGAEAARACLSLIAHSRRFEEVDE